MRVRSKRTKRIWRTRRSLSGTLGAMCPLADMGGYLTRIGASSASTLTEIHRAHSTSIPFENFDSYSDRPVSLDIEHLEDKLVARRRGGYCFEQNLLLKGALESLGVDLVEPMLARVRTGSTAPGPLNHLLLRVVENKTTWLADVGFGGAGLLDPLPFEVGVDFDQSGWHYRITQDGQCLVVQVHQDGAWTDLYSFDPAPVPMVDIEVSNWYTATHPESAFVKGIMGGARSVDRCLAIFVYEQAVLVEREVGESSSVTEVVLRDVPRLLAERFGIGGVSLDASGRLVMSGDLEPMVSRSWDPEGRAEKALQTVVAAFGMSALDEDRLLANRLGDLLLEETSPREQSLILASARRGIASELAELFAEGVGMDSAIRLSVERLNAKEPLDPTGCDWVVRLFYRTLGLTPNVPLVEAAPEPEESPKPTG
jgi:N-hydroxyarylamine O-acetyltransferase